MDAKTVLKELNEVAERAFSLISDREKNDEHKPNLDLYRLADGLHSLGSRIERYGIRQSVKFDFGNIRWLIEKGNPTQDSLFLYPYPNLMSQHKWERDNDKIYLLKGAEKLLRGCIAQDETDQSLQDLLADLMTAQRAYAGYYARAMIPKALSDTALEEAIEFLKVHEIPHDDFIELRNNRVKKDDCQDEMV
jgi:hypothetical protein